MSCNETAAATPSLPRGTTYDLTECQACGVLLQRTRGAKPRKWCSERCRKTKYEGVCADCDAKIKCGAKRCKSCAQRVCRADRPPATPRPIEERFWPKVDKTEDCWLWTASDNSMGYGQLMIARRPRLAHRLAWELEHGPIPVGMHVLHRCDTPRCVRPDHLFLGTHADNMADMAAKGRGHWQRSAA